MKNKIIILLLLSASLIFASGGSIYTRYGIGNLILSSSAREVGMGNSGLALNQRDNIGLLNPASWNSIELTRFTIGASFIGYDMSDKSTSAFYSETDFSGLVAAFPISNDYGITLVGGLTPYSNINYDVRSEQDDAVLGRHTFEYTGNGGLSKAFIGASYNLPFGGSIGASFDYYSGKTEYTSLVEFNENTDFNNTEYILNLKSNASSFSLGLISPNIAPLLKMDKISNFTIGATYQLPITQNVDSVGSVDNSTGYSDYLNTGFEREIPARLGLGLALKWNENYTFVFDFVNQSFSNFTVDGAKSAFLRDYSRFALGFEYRHSSGRFGSTWEQMIWRAGLSYEQSQYIINKEGIDEMAAYAGFSFPMGADNSLDFGFKYGMRGTTDFGLVKENIFAAYLTINFGDLWFIRPQR